MRRSNARVDFSRNAKVYDSRHGAVLPETLARRLIKSARLEAGSRILEVGAGTGRVAIAFAQQGCHVTALEPSMAMLTELRAKATGLPLRVVAGEGAHVPFPALRFDAVALARVLYLMSDWQEVLIDALRVLTPNGFVLHEWGNGDVDEEWVQIRTKTRALFEEEGSANPFHPGVRSEAEVEGFLSERGFDRTDEVRADSDQRMTLAQFLDRIEDGECSYAWNVPIEIQRRCLPELRAWAEARFDMHGSVPFPREVNWKTYRRQHDRR